MKRLEDLKIKIFADGANLQTIKELAKDPLIKGFTTNPTLMRRAGVEDYERFAKEVLEVVEGRPVSFEVIADDVEGMVQQAKLLNSWGKNVVVKIPVTNSKGDPSYDLIKLLARTVRVNVTAVMTWPQAVQVVDAMRDGIGGYISIFAGRVADTGIDPLPLIKRSVGWSKEWPQIEIIWASPREILNIFQADQVGCHIITVTQDLWYQKKDLIGKDLDQYSLETVQQFKKDADASGFKL